MKTLNTILIIAFAGLLLVSCNEPDKKEQLKKLLVEREKLTDEINKLQAEIGKSGDTTGEHANMHPVVISDLATSTFKHYIDVQAKVDVDESVNVNPKMGGTVTAILVKEGDQVKTGQVLATLDDQLLKNSINEVQGQLDFATNVYQKQKALWDQKIGSEIQYLTAKNNKESLERKIITLREQADMMKVKSPINGTVDNIYIKIGQSIMPGLPCINVVNLSGLKIKAEVAEAYIARIKTGDEVIISVPDLKKVFTAKVSFASSVVNNVTRSFTVEVRLAGNELNLKPNMLAVMRINDYKNDSAISIPINVVQNSADGAYVFVAENENGKLIARKKMIQPGLSYNSTVEIKEGLRAGDKLITTGQSDVNDGEEVKN